MEEEKKEAEEPKAEVDKTKPERKGTLEISQMKQIVKNEIIDEQGLGVSLISDEDEESEELVL